MSKNIYIGINGKPRRVKSLYIGINGVPRKIKYGYIGINSVPRLFYSSLYRYVGQCGVIGGSTYGTIDSYSRTYVDDHWELYMKTTRTSSSSTYPSFNEFKITSDESLVGKSISITYKLSSYSSSNIFGYVQFFNSSGTFINGYYLTSTTKNDIYNNNSFKYIMDMYFKFYTKNWNE